jgi:hypothetical protein
MCSQKPVIPAEAMVLKNHNELKFLDPVSAGITMNGVLRLFTGPSTREQTHKQRKHSHQLAGFRFESTESFSVHAVVSALPTSIFPKSWHVDCRNS